jgi:hypothetical protein
MIEKNRAVQRDRRLARLQQFDVRSKKYPVRKLVASEKPRSYTWPCDAVLDQGPDGACVGFAVTHELIAIPVAVESLNAQFAKEEIYWEAQKIDPWEGGSYPGASTFYEGTSVLAGIKAAQKRGFINEYRWAFGLEDLILAVGHCGPAIVGINWYESMFDPFPCGYLHPFGQIAGGHAILVRGVNVTHQYFTLHNSWGPGWGDNGTAKITWDEMDRLLHEGGEAVIPTRRADPTK